MISNLFRTNYKLNQILECPICSEMMTRDVGFGIVFGYNYVIPNFKCKDCSISFVMKNNKWLRYSKLTLIHYSPIPHYYAQINRYKIRFHHERKMNIHIEETECMESFDMISKTIKNYDMLA